MATETASVPSHVSRGSRHQARARGDGQLGLIGWWTGTGRVALTTWLMTAGVWALVLSGPVIGGVALSRISNLAPIPTASGTSGAPSAPESELAQEFAVRAVTEWMAGSTAPALGRSANSPGEATGVLSWQADLPAAGSSVERRLTDARVADVTWVGDRSWSITVAGRVQTKADRRASGGSPSSGRWVDRGPVRYFQLGVRESTSAPRPSAAPAVGVSRASLTTIGLPSEVAAPTVGQRPALAYGPTVPGASGGLQETLTSFILAYLTGQPGMDRHLAPGTHLPAPARLGYEDARVIGVAAADGVDLTEPVPATAGRRLRLLVTAQPSTDLGPGPVSQYALELRARAGRWEVAALDKTPLLAESNSQNPRGPSR